MTLPTIAVFEVVTRRLSETVGVLVVVAAAELVIDIACTIWFRGVVKEKSDSFLNQVPYGSAPIKSSNITTAYSRCIAANFFVVADIRFRGTWLFAWTA